MDVKDLISYLDKRFDGIDKRFAEVDKRFEESERRMRQFVEEAVGRVTRQIEALRQETAERFEKVETEIRHARVLIEGLRSDLKGVAEGVVNVNEKLDRELERLERQRLDDQAADRVVLKHHQRRLDDHEDRLSGLESVRP